MKLEVRSFFICLALILLSCSRQSSSPELEKHFTKTQIEDLNMIRLFFINNIAELKENDFSKKFITQLEKMEASGMIPIPQQKIDSVLSKISKSTYDEVWVRQNNSISFNGNFYDYLNPKYQGKYQNFLADISKNNKSVNDYYKRMISSGDFSRLSMLGYLKNHSEEFDLENINIQILLAVHYISVLRDIQN